MWLKNVDVFYKIYVHFFQILETGDFFFFNILTKSKKKSKKNWVCVFGQVLSYKKLRRTSETSSPDLDRTVAQYAPLAVCLIK